MKRAAEERLGKWFGSAHRKPLLMRGARQVGKSTLVQNFAKGMGLRLNEINLERHRDLGSVFSSMDPAAICARLGAFLGREIRTDGSLLFIDEIQAVPEAIAALRYWLREGGKNNAEVDYIVAEGPRILPVEVKAGKTGTLRSLHLLMGAKGLRRALRFDAGRANSRRVALPEGGDYELETLPLYAAACLNAQSE